MPEVRGAVVLDCRMPGVIHITDTDLIMAMGTMVTLMDMETTTIVETMLTMENVRQALLLARKILMITTEHEELPRMFLLPQAGTIQEDA